MPSSATAYVLSHASAAAPRDSDDGLAQPSNPYSVAMPPIRDRKPAEELPDPGVVGLATHPPRVNVPASASAAHPVNVSTTVPAHSRAPGASSDAKDDSERLKLAQLNIHQQARIRELTAEIDQLRAQKSRRDEVIPGPALTRLLQIGAIPVHFQDNKQLGMEVEDLIVALSAIESTLRTARSTIEKTKLAPLPEVPELPEGFNDSDSQRRGEDLRIRNENATKRRIDEIKESVAAALRDFSYFYANLGEVFKAQLAQKSAGRSAQPAGSRGKGKRGGAARGRGRGRGRGGK